jgi:SAM-dependent methyltransferase
MQWWWSWCRDDDVRRQRFVLRDYDHTAFAQHSRILDLGCGEGEQLRSLAARGCVAVGVDVRPPPATVAALPGVHLVLARAEHLPFRARTFDGAVTKVVLPYTDEAVAVSEMARVLRAGATWHLTVHGVGYYLDYAILSGSLKRRVYALRTMINTGVYRATGARWIAGDTIYQSLRSLSRYCGRAGLRITRMTASPKFLCTPVFVYLRLVAAHAPAVEQRPPQRRVA